MGQQWVESCQSGGRMGKGSPRVRWQRVRPWGEGDNKQIGLHTLFQALSPHTLPGAQVKEKVGRMVEKGWGWDTQGRSCSLSSLWNKMLNLQGKEWKNFPPQGTDEIPLQLRGKGNFKKCWLLSERQEYVLGSEPHETCPAVGNIPLPVVLPHPVATPRLLVRIFTPKVIGSVDQKSTSLLPVWVELESAEILSHSINISLPPKQNILFCWIWSRPEESGF